jgi:hypothetical protein
MSVVHTQLLRLSGLGESAPEVERHLESWIEASSPSQLIGLIDPGALALLKDAFSQAGGCEGTVWLIDRQADELVACYNSGEESDLLVGFRQPVGQGIISMVFAQQQPYCENDIEASVGHDDTLDRKIAKHTTAMIANDVGQSGVDALGLNLGVKLGLKIAKKELRVAAVDSALGPGETRIAGELPPADPGRGIETISVEDLANLR